MLVIGVAMMATVQQIVISHRGEIRDAQKSFAYQKAMALVSELQVAVDRGRIANTKDLDAIASLEPNAVLTTAQAELTPDHPMSGNVGMADGGWRWARTIEVEEIPEVERIRYARVKILRKDRAGNYVVEASAGSVLSLPTATKPSIKEYDVYLLAIAGAPSLWLPLPELRALIESTVSGIEQSNPNLRFNLHWITKLGYGRNQNYTPFVNEEQTATTTPPFAYWYPGKLASGEPYTRLYSSELFSGRVRTEAGVLHDYHETNNPFPHAVADRWNHCMREPEARALFKQRVMAGLEKADEPPLQLLLEDMHKKPELFRNALVLNLHGSGLPFPPLRNYSDPAKVEDMRVVAHPTKLHLSPSDGKRPLVALSEEFAFYASQTTGWYQMHLEYASQYCLQADTESESQASTVVNQTLDYAIAEIEHMVLDGWQDVAQVESWTKAIDAQKTAITAGTYTNSQSGSPLDLRVYAYKADPATGAAVMGQPITIKIPGLDLTANVNGSTNPSLFVGRSIGGVDTSTGEAKSDGVCDYERLTDPEGVPPRKGSQSAPFEMHFDYGYVASPEPYTWIKLYNTPLVTPPGAQPGELIEGISAQKRLYGLEYIPSPMRTDAPYATDLDHEADVAKNTARWLIRIPAGILKSKLGETARRIDIETRIGEDLTTGQAWPTANQPENISRTYAWYAATSSAVPLTERYQFQGDPRHNPYVDLLEGGAFPHGYNAYFDDLRTSTQDATVEYPCLDATRLEDGFGAGGVRLDVPRAMQVWRSALQSSSAVFVNAGGVPFSEILIGGEICLPRSGQSVAPQAIHVSTTYAGGDDSCSLNSVVASHGGEDSASAGGILRNSGSFWTKPWIGELYDPSTASAWTTDGNVATGWATNKLVYRSMHTTTLARLPFGTTFDKPCSSSLGQLGNASMLQLGPSTNRIVFPPSWHFESLLMTDAGKDILAAAGISDHGDVLGAPSTSGTLPEPLPQAGWTTLYPDLPAKILSLLSTCTTGSPGVKVQELGSLGGATSAFFVMVAELPTDSDGHRRLAQRALLFGLRGLHEAGVSAYSNDVAQVPTIEVLQPTPQKVFDNPSSIEVQWSSSFVRFDGKPFSPRYPAEYTGNDSTLQYAIVYSTNGGSTYHYASSGDPVEGPVPTSEWINDMAPGNESYVLFTPSARIPAGELLIRIYTRESGRRVHLSRHDALVEIRR